MDSLEYKICERLILAGKIEGMENKISLLTKYWKIEEKEMEYLISLLDKWK